MVIHTAVPITPCPAPLTRHSSPLAPHPLHPHPSPPIPLTPVSAPSPSPHPPPPTSYLPQVHHLGVVNAVVLGKDDLHLVALLLHSPAQCSHNVTFAPHLSPAPFTPHLLQVHHLGVVDAVILGKDDLYLVPLLLHSSAQCSHDVTHASDLHNR